jgi:hypothetical protein
VEHSRRPILLFLSTVVVLACGCDPGYHYQPIDSKGHKVSEWSETIDGIRFSVEPYTTLIGSYNALIYLQVVNQTEEEVVVLGGQLLTNGRTIEARILDDPENRKARTVPPGSSKRVLLLWELGGSASNVLGSELVFVWRVQIGKAERTVKVGMERQKQ